MGWGAQIPTAAELYEEYGPAVAATTLTRLKNVCAAEPGITADMAEAAPADCHLHGLEFRIKSPASLARKITTKVRASRRHPDEVGASLTDIVRYTVVAPTGDRVVTAADQTLAELTRRGWDITSLEHSFVPGNPYKGLHAILHHRGTGVDAELQFHSQTAIAIKDRYHVEYEVMRDVTRPASERLAAYDAMVAAWSNVPTPSGLEEFAVGGTPLVQKAYGAPAPRRTKTT